MTCLNTQLWYQLCLTWTSASQGNPCNRHGLIAAPSDPYSWLSQQSHFASIETFFIFPRRDATPTAIPAAMHIFWQFDSLWQQIRARVHALIWFSVWIHAFSGGQQLTSTLSTMEKLKGLLISVTFSKWIRAVRTCCTLSFETYPCF